VGFLGNIGFSLYRSFGSLYFAEIVGVHRVSGMFVAAAIAELPILYFGGRFLMRLGHRRMLIIAQLSILLRLSLLAFLPYALPVLLSQLTHAFCYGFYLIAGVDWVNRTIGPKKRALGMGMFHGDFIQRISIYRQYCGGLPPGDRGIRFALWFRDPLPRGGIDLDHGGSQDRFLRPPRRRGREFVTFWYLKER
jgi:hypothetical protein